MSKVVLVLGTNAGQVDLILYMKSIGWKVIGCSYRSGESGEHLCDVFEQVDIRNIDLLEDISKKYKVNLVYSVSSDIAMRSVVSLSERLGLPHYFNSEFIDLLDDKTSLREFLNGKNISVVNYSEISKPEQTSAWSSFPCVVKPVDGQGQRGVELVNSNSELNNAVKNSLFLSDSKRAIIEEYLDGVELSCNLMINNGNILLCALSERLVHEGLSIGIPRGHLIPARNVSKADLDLSDKLVRDIVSALSIQDGVLYFQMIITSSGPKIVEIAPRLDGCHMWRMIKYSHKVNLVELAVSGLIGNCEQVEETQISNDENLELMFQQMSPSNLFNKSEFLPPKDFYYHEYRYNDDQEVLPINGRMEVVGYYVKESDS